MINWTTNFYLMLGIAITTVMKIISNIYEIKQQNWYFGIVKNKSFSCSYGLIYSSRKYEVYGEHKHVKSLSLEWLEHRKSFEKYWAIEIKILSFNNELFLIYLV